VNALLFNIERPWDKEIQVCNSNEVPGVLNDHALRGHRFIKFYFKTTAKNFKIFS